jgi:hypothetical protein
MREPRYRFSDAIRATTRAIALRMMHAGEIAASPQELREWIDRTEDVRERLAVGGYGQEFSADDLFPLFQGAVARATAAKAGEAKPDSPRRFPMRMMVIVAAIVVAVIVIVAYVL